MNTNYLIIGLVAFLVLSVAVYFLMPCKKGFVNVNGKCYQVLVQKEPAASVAVTGLAKLIDNDIKTGSDMTTEPVELTLASKEGPMKLVKGVRVVAMAKAPATATTEKAKLVLKSGDKSLNLELPQNGKVVNVGALFPADLKDVQSLTLSVPANITLYEVQIV